MTQLEELNTNDLSTEITANFIDEFQDKETRHVYVNEFLNTKIATQIKVLREQNQWTQEKLAEETGMRQERISVLEDVNYEAWTLNILRRFAEAFDLRLNVSFEDFGSFLGEFTDFGRADLERKSFKDDPAFKKQLSNVNPQTNKKASATTTPFRVVPPTEPIKVSTEPKPRYRHLELAYSQSEIKVEREDSRPILDEKNKPNSTFAPMYSVAIGTR